LAGDDFSLGSGTTGDLKRLHILSGIDAINALGEGDNARTGETIHNLLPSPLVGNQTGMTQDLQVTRRRRGRATRH
jgi:hypothetical protein